MSNHSDSPAARPPASPSAAAPSTHATLRTADGTPLHIPDSYREPNTQPEPLAPDPDLPAVPQHVTPEQRARLDAHGFDPADYDWEPVHRQRRYNGWTVEAQRGFIAALADTGSVEAAARAVAMSVRSAYALRRAPGTEQFARAWGLALDAAAQRLADLAFDRAMNGTEEAVRNREGTIVGYKRKHSDQLLMFLLRAHQPDVYGRKPAAAAPSVPAAPVTRLVTGAEQGALDDALLRELALIGAASVIRSDGDLLAVTETAEPAPQLAPPPTQPLTQLGHFLAPEALPAEPLATAQAAAHPAASPGEAVAAAIARLGPQTPPDPLAAMHPDDRAALLFNLDEDARAEARMKQNAKIE
jgi:hypothetical protein